MKTIQNELCQFGAETFQVKYKKDTFTVEREIINPCISVCHFQGYDIVITNKNDIITMVLVINMSKHYLVNEIYEGLDSYKTAIELALEYVFEDIEILETETELFNSIRDYFASNPKGSIEEIADKISCSIEYVTQVKESIQN